MEYLLTLKLLWNCKIWLNVSKEWETKNYYRYHKNRTRTCPELQWLLTTHQVYSSNHDWITWICYIKQFRNGVFCDDMLISVQNKNIYLIHKKIHCRKRFNSVYNNKVNIYFLNASVLKMFLILRLRELVILSYLFFWHITFSARLLHISRILLVENCRDVLRVWINRYISAVIWNVLKHTECKKLLKIRNSCLIYSYFS